MLEVVELLEVEDVAFQEVVMVEEEEVVVVMVAEEEVKRCL